MSSGQKLNALREMLDTVADGPITDTAVLSRLLVEVWPELYGSTEEATEAWKVERLENIAWVAPLLDFTLERHAAQ